MQKLLEGANIKLSSVVTDVMGVSARAMLAQIVAGQTDAELMADLARGPMRSKIPQLEKALTGIVQPHHRFVLTQQLDHIDFLDDKIETISLEIERQLESMSWPEEPAMPDAGEAIEEGTPLADQSERR